MGVDRDPALVALARSLVQQRGLANVELVEGDAWRTGLPPASFDVVHARTLLINVPDPGSVVAEMSRLARPGGWVVGMEPDGAGRVSYPPNPAIDRLHEIFGAALDDAARTYLADPATLVVPHLFFLTWGRRPAD